MNEETPELSTTVAENEEVKEMELDENESTRETTNIETLPGKDTEIMEIEVQTEILTLKILAHGQLKQHNKQ